VDPSSYHRQVQIQIFVGILPAGPRGRHTHGCGMPEYPKFLVHDKRIENEAGWNRRSSAIR
jgi:hypothetical protein